MTGDVPSYGCSMCGQRIRATLPATLAHVLTRWHDPLKALADEWLETETRALLMVGLVAAFAVGAAIVEVILAAFGQAI